MDSQETANNMAEPASGHGETVKPNAPSPPQGFQTRPQGPPLSPRNSINNGPIGAPRPGPPLRRLDSRSSLGPPAAGQFVQLRPYGPPRPPGGSFPPRSPQPGQLPPQNPLHPASQRFAYSPGIRGPPPQAGGQRPPFVGNYQLQQQQQQPRFQRPDIAAQNGPPRSTAEAAQYRPGSQDAAFPRHLLRNDSLLNLQRQHLLSNEEIKQPTRPRIVIERMADVNEGSGDVAKLAEGYPQKKKPEARENGENDDDDDDDVVMDSEKSPRHDANGLPTEALLNGSKSTPSTPRKHEDTAASRPATAERQDVPSRPVSATNDDKPKTNLADDDSAPVTTQRRPSSAAASGDQDEGREEKPPSRPQSSKEADVVKESSGESTKSDTGATSPPVDDSKVDGKASPRPPSSTSIAEAAEEAEQPPASPYSNEALGNAEASLKAPSRLSDNSRSSTPSYLETPQNAEQTARTPSSRSSDKSRSSTPAGLAEPESRTPVKTPDKSRSSTPAGLAEPTGAAEPESKTPMKTPDKSRSSTPAGLAEPESRTPVKTPDKSRSSTPAGLTEPTGAAEPESRTPVKTPDKSRSSTPAGPLEPPQSAGRESRPPSKSPDKSRTSTPAEQTPPPRAERESSATPATKTPDRSRSATPVAGSGTEPSNEVEKPPESLQRDKSRDEDTLQVLRDPSRPASSLGSLEKDSKSPRSPTTPDSQGKLSVPGSLTTPPRSPEETVKGFDNGRQRSLSSRTSASGSPRSPSSPKSPAGSVKQPDGEKKRTSFAEDTTVVKKATEKTPCPTTATSPSKPTTPAAKIPRTATPAKLGHERAELKSSEKKAVQNGSASESQANAVPTTNGVAESPTKKSPSKSKDSDKRSTAGSPTKSPSKSSKSLPRTPETPLSTAQEKKKVPMNKVQVGAAPSPNLKTVRSKIGSLDNASYKPGGGKVKIENRKLDFSKAQPKIAAKNEKYTPSGGDKKISQVKLQWNAKPKVGSLENATYKPGGGDKKIETVKLDFKDKAKPKVGSKENAKHVPGGGAVKIPTQKMDIKAESKIGSLDNMKHKPGGGDKKIFNDRDYLRQTSSNVESLNGSGSQSPVPSGAITDGKNGLPASDENLNQEC
ncbi:microtubule-associated protein tau isoform X2 [Harpegnathos saltator]|uniref:microtubule-associated protein tau isoform X2 n=1 Tax=Harpegnathos saltator TaxID=610380 RepID=UPI000DBEE036|nr:microtubule-associated protein tau isoform X2 [Harpegnathos saltator]